MYQSVYQDFKDFPSLSVAFNPLVPTKKIKTGHKDKVYDLFDSVYYHWWENKQIFIF